MVLDNSNVGIGTTNPIAKLQVNGNLRIGSSNDDTTSENKTFRMNSAAQLVIHANKSGLNSDSNNLLLRAGGTNYGQIYLGGGTENEDRTIKFKTSGSSTENMRIHYNGNVGIGTETPSEKLHVNGKIIAENVLIGGPHKDYSYESSCFFANKDRYNAANHSHALFTNSSGLTTLNSSNGKNVAITYENNYNFVFKPDAKFGIGTTDPYFPLHVVGVGGGTEPNKNRRYFKYNTGLTTDNLGSSPASIYANNDIISGNYFISAQGAANSSDERIKKDISDINDGEALNILRLLKPKKYSYKDTIQRGSEPVWGFIAQEVRDTLPYATLKKNDFIPNIYELANVSNSNVIIFTNFNTSNLESDINTVIRIIDINDKEHNIHLTEIIDEHSIRVEEDLDEWMGSVDESGNVIDGSQIFVYGEEVHDFYVLKKDAIFTVATAALQEVDRQQQADKARILELETQLASVLTRLNALENA